MAITVKSNDTANHAGLAFVGAVYLAAAVQNLDKITPAATPLSLNKNYL